jgi:hypothetical protein
MAEDRDPGLDNQERPERDAMEQGIDLPDQDADDDGGQNPSDEENR